jgi:hypothetical protein
VCDSNKSGLREWLKAAYREFQCEEPVGAFLSSFIPGADCAEIFFGERGGFVEEGLTIAGCFVDVFTAGAGGFLIDAAKASRFGMEAAETGLTFSDEVVTLSDEVAGLPDEVLDDIASQGDKAISVSDEAPPVREAGEEAATKPGARFTVDSNGVVTDSLGASSKGLVGSQYEDFLGSNLGGKTNVSYGGRQFDVEVPGGNGIGSTLIEAKSGNYWSDVVSSPEGFAKFKSDIGSRAAIARARGSNFMVYSNTPIPANVQSWLSEKGIPFREF